MGRPSDKGDTVLAVKEWLKRIYPTLTGETRGMMAGYAVGLLWSVVPDLYPDEFVWLLDNKLHPPKHTQDWYKFVRRSYTDMTQMTKHLDKHGRIYTANAKAGEWASDARKEVAMYYKHKKAKPL